MIYFRRCYINEIHDPTLRQIEIKERPRSVQVYENGFDPFNKQVIGLITFIELCSWILGGFSNNAKITGVVYACKFGQWAEVF